MSGKSIEFFGIIHALQFYWECLSLICETLRLGVIVAFNSLLQRREGAKKTLIKNRKMVFFFKLRHYRFIA